MARVVNKLASPSRGESRSQQKVRDLCQRVGSLFKQNFPADVGLVQARGVMPVVTQLSGWEQMPDSGVTREQADFSTRRFELMVSRQDINLAEAVTLFLQLVKDLSDYDHSDLIDYSEEESVVITENVAVYDCWQDISEGELGWVISSINGFSALRLYNIGFSQDWSFGLGFGVNHETGLQEVGLVITPIDSEYFEREAENRNMVK